MSNDYLKVISEASIIRGTNNVKEILAGRTSIKKNSIFVYEHKDILCKGDVLYKSDKLYVVCETDNVERDGIVLLLLRNKNGKVNIFSRIK